MHTEELRKFFLDKTGEVAHAEMNKEDMAEGLEEYDERAVFRFGALPEEIRRKFYKNLAFHPQILATCQKIHDEAQNILPSAATRLVIEGLSIRTASSAMRMNLSGEFQRSTPPRFKIDSRDWVIIRCTNGSILMVGIALESWPVEVATATQLEVEVIVESRTMRAVNHLLYFLATKLNTALRVKLQLHVHATDHSGFRFDGPDVHSMLYPLTKMGPGVFVTFKECPAELCRSCKNAIVGSQSATTVLHDYLQLVKELCSDMALMQRAGMSKMPHYTVLHFLQRLELEMFQYYDADMERLLARALSQRVEEVFPPARRSRMKEAALAILAHREMEEAEKRVDVGEMVERK